MIALSKPALFSLEDLARVAGGAIAPDGRTAAAARAADSPVTGASIDTRTLERGDLFVPLPGGRADGHDFIREAFARGAAASLCARERRASLGDGLGGPLVLVDDVTAALQRLAQVHRQAWSGLLIGITGSSGKTTTKDLVAAVFAASLPTLKTEGNLNNHWGVPLTLLRLAPVHRAAVVEMGTNHPGEIEALAHLAAPTSAVITNVGSAHLEHFGSIEAIAREKASLAFSLLSGGVTFAGADSPPLMRALGGAPSRIVTFGLGAQAQVRPRSLEDLGPAGSRFEVDGFPPIHLALVGRHQVLNALAALAVAREFALDPALAAGAIEEHRAGHGRMEVRRAHGASLLVDCYNANPESTRAALDTLASWPDARRRIAVLSDMLELGPQAPQLHRAAGGSVRAAELWTVGANAQDYAAGAREKNVEVRVFPDRPALAEALREALEPGTVVLLKASRGAALERVLEGLEWEE